MRQFIPATRRIMPIVFGACFTLLIAAVVFSVTLVLMNGDTIIRGLRLGNTPLNNTTYEELGNFLQTQAVVFANSPITLVLPDGSQKQVPPARLGASLQTQTTQQSVFSVGRNPSPMTRATSQLQALIWGAYVPYSGKVERETLETFVQNNLAPFHDPADEARLVYATQQDSFIVQPSSEGRVIDIDALEQNILNHISTLSQDPILLVQKDDSPSVTTKDAQALLPHAIDFLKQHPVRLAYEEGEWDVEKEDFASWIAVARKEQGAGVYIDVKKVEDYLTQFAPGINKPPVDAVFAVENGHVTAFQLSRAGRELLVRNSAERIAQALGAGESSATLIVKNTEPNITSEKINTLGITSLLASGESDFAGSPKNRIHNIGIGASKFDGVIIPPGKEFSFNKTLGKVTEKEGYLPELVIKKDKTVPEYGGGLCQVSTTLFRAAIYAGLQITERFAHAYPVRYYGTPGFDATIYPPSPDLKFKNTTNGHILIQHKIKGTKLIFELYGTDDGRRVELEGPVTYDKKDDGSIKALLTQRVFDKEGTLMFQKKFYSNYKSPALYPINRNPLE